MGEIWRGGGDPVISFQWLQDGFVVLLQQNFQGNRREGERERERGGEEKERGEGRRGGEVKIFVAGTAFYTDHMYEVWRFDDKLNRTMQKELPREARRKSMLSLSLSLSLSSSSPFAYPLLLSPPLLFSPLQLELQVARTEQLSSSMIQHKRCITMLSKISSSF